MIWSAGSRSAMKWRRAAPTWRILSFMLPLTSRASASRRGRRSPLKSVTSWRFPSSETRKSVPLRPRMGCPFLSRTDTGTRTVRVPAVKMGSGPRRPAGRAGGEGAAGGGGGGAARRTATTSVSLAPASRRAISSSGSSGSPNPRSASSVRMLRSLRPASRKRTRSAVMRGVSPGVAWAAARISATARSPPRVRRVRGASSTETLLAAREDNLGTDLLGGKGSSSPCPPPEQEPCRPTC